MRIGTGEKQAHVTAVRHPTSCRPWRVGTRHPVTGAIRDKLHGHIRLAQVTRSRRHDSPEKFNANALCPGGSITWLDVEACNEAGEGWSKSGPLALTGRPLMSPICEAVKL